MARLRLLQPYEMQPVGTVIEVPGGVASILLLRKIAEFDREPASAKTEIEAKGETTPPAKATKPVARKPRARKAAKKKE